MRVWCANLVRQLLCINRLMLLCIASAAVVYFLLYRYDSGSNNALDVTISGGMAAAYLLVAIHMLIDRRLIVWTLSAIGVLFTALCAGSLFGFFFWQWWRGQMDSGQAQGWLDTVRTAAIIGGPALVASIALFRYRKWRTGQDALPGEILMAPATDDWDGTTERRVGPDDRRGYVAAEDY
jgi:hypothetical protein